MPRIKRILAYFTKSTPARKTPLLGELCIRQALRHHPGGARRGSLLTIATGQLLLLPRALVVFEDVPRGHRRGRKCKNTRPEVRRIGATSTATAAAAASATATSPRATAAAASVSSATAAANSPNWRVTASSTARSTSVP